MPKLIGKPPVGRPEQLAVNVEDLQRLTTETKWVLLSGRLSTDGFVRYQPANPLKPTEIAVRLTCDLLEAATICEVIRGYDRSAGDRPTRIYVRPDGTADWRPVPADLRLVRSLPGGTAALEPKLFAPVAAGVVPLPPRRVVL